MKKIKQVLSNHTEIESELLLSYITKKDKVFILTHPECQISFWQYWYFIYLLSLFHRGYSVAAITHHKEFFGLDFFVNKNVLIPRPDTELIVNLVLNDLKQLHKNILLIDVGTGSGCIPISILKNTNKIQTTIALDISSKALQVARKNIDKILDSRLQGNSKTKIELIKSNLLKKISNQDYQSFNQIIITANLPYLTEKQVKQEPSIQKEPKIALVAKENGLALYRQLLEQITKIFLEKKLLILFEIDPTQSKNITTLAKQYLPQAKLEIKKDLAGLDRILKISS